MPSTAPTRPIRSSTALSRCCGVELAVLAQPFHLVEDRVLRLLLPVEQEHVLPQRVEVVVGLDAAAVVRLRKQLDVAGQRQHGPGRRGEHGMRPRRWAAAGSGSPPACPAAVIASRRRNISWCLSSSSVRRTSASSATWSPSQWSRLMLEHLGADEALDQREHVGVGAALHLREEALLVRRSGTAAARPSTGRRAGTSRRSRSCGRG